LYPPDSCHMTPWLSWTVQVYSTMVDAEGLCKRWEQVCGRLSHISSLLSATQSCHAFSEHTLLLHMALHTAYNTSHTFCTMYDVQCSSSMPLTEWLPPRTLCRLMSIKTTLI
jgi:hypothetical protein